MGASLLDRLRPRVDATIASLERKRFRTDPIGGDQYSRATSIVSAAYKRHGQILETAIRERLSDCSYFTVWHEPTFWISSSADHAISGRNADIADSLPIEMPYLDARPGSGRSIQVDAFVFDRRVQTLRSYEIKRGNGDFDAGKKRSILRDLLVTQSLLKSYGDKRGLKPSIAEARIVSYYGVKPLPDPLSLSGDELDDHFVFPIKRDVDSVNVYFQEQLYAVLRRVTGLHPTASSLCPTCPNRLPELVN